MARNSRKQSNAKIRAEYVEKVKSYLEELGEDVGLSKSNEVNFPILNDLGMEEWVTITVRVPTGSRDGEPYDGYGEREDYNLTVEKAKEREEEKRKKLEKINAEKLRKRKEKEEIRKRKKEEEEGE